MLGRLAERVEFWQDLGVRRPGAALVGVFEGPTPEYSYTKAVLGHRTPRATEILSLPMCDLDSLRQSTQTQH